LFEKLLIDIKPLISSLVIKVKKEFRFLKELEELSKKYNLRYEVI